MEAFAELLRDCLRVFEQVNVRLGQACVVGLRERGRGAARMVRSLSLAKMSYDLHYRCRMHGSGALLH